MVSNIIRFGNYFLKILAVSVIVLILISSFTPIALNAMSLPDFLKPTCNGNSCPFYFLAPINFPGFNIQGGVMDVGGNGASNYLKGLYTFGIAIASALAVIVIVIGGVQYASTDAIGGKSEGKSKITAALTGLVLALLSYTLLNTINPYLVSNSFNPQTIAVAPGIGNGGINPDGGAVTPVPENPGTGGGGGVTGGGYMPNAEWNQYALNAIRNSQLNGATPRDLAQFFPDGQSTPENWLKLMSSMAKLESGFDPNLTYQEDFTDNNGNYVQSTGLFQVSQESSRGYGFTGITTNDLKDPYKNIDVAVKIMENWVVKDNCIACGQDSGASRYWSVLRNEDKLNQIKGDLKTVPTQQNP